MRCPECKQAIETQARPGAQVTCPSCEASVRVPLRKAGGREIECPACGVRQRTGAAPGRRVSCKGCGVEVRVPMREAAPGATVRCPECDAERETRTPPGKRTTCAACGHAFRVPLPDADAAPQAPSHSLPQHVRLGGGMDPASVPGARDLSFWGSSIGLLLDRGLPGGALLWMAATLWVGFASDEDAYRVPLGALVLYAMGLLAVVSGALKFLSRRGE